MKTKKLTIKEIRIKLHKFENELRKHRGSNKLVDKYLSRVAYMQMHFRLIKINKDILKFGLGFIIGLLISLLIRLNGRFGL
jgi:hypothetical protein